LHSVTGFEGSTYISLADTLRLEKENQLEANDSLKINLPWPTCITHCHPSEQLHGHPLPCLPTFSIRKDLRLLWILDSITLYSNTIWNIFTEHSISTEKENWTG
jgi:hypothetical protein